MDPTEGSDRDLSQLQDTLSASTRQLSTLRISALAAGRAITDVFAKGVIEGRRFEDVLQAMGRRLADGALKSALAPVQAGLGQLIETGARSLFQAFRPAGAGDATGGALASLFGSARPFADGGVVAQPTYFSMGRNLGLMGERGAEAILPLARGPDGKLGVSAGGAGPPVSVTVNISTRDAASFRQSEAQVSAAIARAVARGQRNL